MMETVKLFLLMVLVTALPVVISASTMDNSRKRTKSCQAECSEQNTRDPRRCVRECAQKCVFNCAHGSASQTIHNREHLDLSLSLGGSHHPGTSGQHSAENTFEQNILDAALPPELYLEPPSSLPGNNKKKYSLTMMKLVRLYHIHDRQRIFEFTWFTFPEYTPARLKEVGGTNLKLVPRNPQIVLSSLGRAYAILTSDKGLLGLYMNLGKAKPRASIVMKGKFKVIPMEKGEPEMFPVGPPWIFDLSYKIYLDTTPSTNLGLSSH